MSAGITKPEMKELTCFWLLAVFLFFLPTYQIVSVFCIGAMMLVWIVNGDFRISLKALKQDRNLKMFLLFYLAHIIGLIYTSNYTFAFFDLQSKVSFLLFPLLLPVIGISNEQFIRLKLFFVSGCMMGVVLCLFFALTNYSANPSPHFFYYTYYSHFLHPSYFSMYLNLAVIFLLDELVRKWYAISDLKRIAGIVLCYFFFVSIIQLSARTATVVAGLSTFLFILVRLKDDEWRIRKYVFSFLVLLSLIPLQHFLLNNMSRFADVKTILKEEFVRKTLNEPSTTTEGDESSLNLHQKVWKYSGILGVRNPILGVGTGDIKDELVKIYRENNFQTGVSERLNCHNQFLNTFVTLGLMGLISLLLFYFIGFRISFKYKDWIYFSFLLIVFLNSMTESLFEKQNGILFFAALNMLFYLRNKSNLPTQNSALPTPNEI